MVVHSIERNQDGRQVARVFALAMGILFGIIFVLQALRFESTIPDSPSHHGTGHRLQAFDHFVVRYTTEVVFRRSLTAIT